MELFSCDGKKCGFIGCTSCFPDIVPPVNHNKTLHLGGGTSYSNVVERMECKVGKVGIILTDEQGNATGVADSDDPNVGLRIWGTGSATTNE